jgi:hypothetical protein
MNSKLIKHQKNHQTNEHININFAIKYFMKFEIFLIFLVFFK